jgi:hypothetical protein
MTNIIKPYLQPAFLICVGVLAVAAASKKAAINWWDIWLTKLPIPLQKPLDDIDKNLLAPYTVVHEAKIENKDVLESLGTEDYIQWFLEDTAAEPESPVRYCALFITYYTGDPDRVPHVPEECITGSGDQMLSGGRENIKVANGGVPIHGLDDHDGTVTLPIKYLVFSRRNTSIWESDFKYGVCYFFKVNGDFASSRDETRAIMGANIFGKYSYFSKVEWKFYGQRPGGTVYGSKQEVLGASEKLMSVLLPILESQHWPDWEKANYRQDPNSSPVREE